MITLKEFILRATRFAAVSVLAATIIGCAERSVERLIDDAKQDRKKGHYSSAVLSLKSALQTAPENGEARYLLGLSFYDSNNYPSAETELRRAIDSGYEPARIAIARPLLMMEQFQKVLDQVLFDGNADSWVQAEVLTVRARAAFGLGRVAEARELLDQALAKQPEFADALLTQALLAASDNKAQEAAQLIDRAIANSPNNVDAWMMKGQLSRITSDQTGALEAYQKAVAVSPENTTARLNIAALLIHAGKLDDARQHLNEVHRLAPRVLLTDYLDAWIDVQEKKFPAAREKVLRVLKSVPDHLPSLLLAGAVEFHLGSYAQAQVHLARVLERAPEYLQARKLLVMALTQSGQIQRAVEVLQPGLRLAATDAQLAVLAGEVYLHNNDLAKATQYFEQASRLDPKSSDALTGLGRSRLASGDVDRALVDLASAVQADSDDYRADILLVMANFQRGNLDESLQAMQSLERKQPNNPLTFNLKGAIYLRKNDEASARKYFQQALKVSPAYVAAASNLVELDLKDKNTAAARRHLEGILEREPANVDALKALSDFAPRLGVRPNEIVEMLERARRSNPGSVRIQTMLARAYSQVGDVKRSVEVARDAQASQPESLESLETLGTMQLRAGEAAQAISTYQRLVSLHPKSASVHLRLAQAQAANGDYASASDTLRRALSFQPDFFEAQVALGASELGAGRYASAVKAAQRVQHHFPKSPAGFVLEGDVLMAENKFALAAKAYEAAFAIRKSGALLIKLHSAYARTGKPEAARKRVADWLKEAPDDGSVRLYAAEASRVSGMYKDAIEHYEWLVKQQPENVVILTNLAWTYQRARDSRALETAERVHKLRPEDPIVNDTLGWILVERGDTKRGIELLQRAAKGAPRISEFRFHLAQAFARAGESARARAELERLLVDLPNSQHSREAKQLLAELPR